MLISEIHCRHVHKSWQWTKICFLLLENEEYSLKWSTLWIKRKKKAYYILNRKKNMTLTVFLHQATFHSVKIVKILLHILLGLGLLPKWKENIFVKDVLYTKICTYIFCRSHLLFRFHRSRCYTNAQFSNCSWIRSVYAHDQSF